MNVEEAARFMAELRPGLAVPMHYGLFAENTADPNEFVIACRAREQATRVLELGETLSL
jgi:L-ascorbate metabolism protein UlaG (beta-lactamase superfamily)